jgi:hypothetical protein
VQDAGASLQDTSSLSAESIETAVQSVVDATTTLASDVKDLGRPDTEAGQQAQDTVSELSGTLESDAATLQQAFEDASGGGMTGMLESISTITQTLASMASAVGQAFTELQDMDAADELETAFENADSCADLGS